MLSSHFRLAKEKRLQSELEGEIASLKAEVESANEGLAAAARLSEQLDNKSQVISTLKQELKARDEHLKKARDEISSASNHSAGKVDKCLVKNLVVGYVAADAKKRPDVLRVIATVLDFNAEDRNKSGLEGGRGPLSRQGSAALDQSLAQAFVQFLVCNVHHGGMFVNYPRYIPRLIP